MDGQWEESKTYDEQIKRWTEEHFQTILNCPEPLKMRDFGSDKHSITSSLDINIAPFPEEQVENTVNRLKNGKVAKVDKVQPELLKCSKSIVP